MLDNFIDSLRERGGWHGGSDYEFIDLSFPWARTPSFLRWSEREIENSPTAYDMMKRALDHGPKAEWGITLQAGVKSSLPFWSPVNEYLQKHYTMKALRVWEDVTSSKPMIVWELGNGYHLSGSCCDAKVEEVTPIGNYYLSLLWRHQDYAHCRNDGARRLRKFVLKLAEMPGCPPNCFFKPVGYERLPKQAVQLGPLKIDYSRKHTTEDLIKIYNLYLGAKKTNLYDRKMDSHTYLCGCYRPADPMVLPKELEIPQLTLNVN
jgi:hypothetical protein